MKQIAVIGAGTMGNGIAHVFAQKGFKVNLIDTQAAALEKAMQTIQKNLDRQLAKNVIDEATKTSTLANIITITSIQEGVYNADLVVEAATENSEIKKSIFTQLDQHAPSHCILASNTSSISITQMAAEVSHPDRFIGMHFFNPVPLMALVEIIRGLQTSDQTHALVQGMAKALGKEPITVKNAPGFVVNRILVPMINEAFFVLAEGLASPEDIDAGMKLGCNHPIGPLALADMIGLDTCLAIMDVYFKNFNDSKYRPCPLLREMVAAGYLGRKTGKGVYSY